MPVRLAFQRNPAPWGRSGRLSIEFRRPVTHTGVGAATHGSRGIVTPNRDGWAARSSPHILDPYGRGACGACPGLSSLKVVGTGCVRFTNSPIARDLGVKSKSEGVPRSTSGGPRMNASLKLVNALVTVSALVAAGAVSGRSTGLNAPILPSTPTVGSEIKRGADAGDRCADLFRMPTRADRFINCIDARQSSNRQSMGTGYEAFDLGIYQTARMNLKVAIEVGGGGNGVLQAKLNLYEVYYRQTRDKLQLTDSEVQRAALIGS